MRFSKRTDSHVARVLYSIMGVINTVARKTCRWSVWTIYTTSYQKIE